MQLFCAQWIDLLLRLSGQNLFFAVTIISAAVMSGLYCYFRVSSFVYNSSDFSPVAAGSTFQAGAYGLGGILSDMKYTGAVMSGQVGD